MKFDIEKAVQGKPVVLRNGNVAYVRYHEKEFGNYLIGCLASKRSSRILEWNINGLSLNYDQECDIAGFYELQFKHWDLLDDELVAIVKDSVGRWIGFKVIPFIQNDRWYAPSNNNECYHLACLNDKLFPECDWKDSLILRPGTN